MIRSVTYLPGQSIYDLCLEAYGTLDLLARFCTDNGITDVDAEPSKAAYVYEDTLVKYQGNNKKFATAVVVANTCPIITGVSVTAIGETGATVTWTGSESGAYEFSYNTTGGEPDAWLPTTSTTRVLTGLVAGTEYFFFVRNVCIGGVYSPTVTAVFETEPGAPVLPITDNLVLSVFSSYGPILDGGTLLKWEDLSGNDNHLNRSETEGPLLEEAVFGTEPGVHFNETLDRQMFAEAALGLNTKTKCTVYTVWKPTIDPGGALLVAGYNSVPGAGSAGVFEIYASTGPEATFLTRGNVGASSGIMDPMPLDAKVYTTIFDFTRPSTQEVNAYKNNSNADFSVAGSSNNTGTFGSYNFFVGDAQGYMGCLIVYAAAHTEEERTTMYEYLADKFSI